MSLIRNFCRIALGIVFIYSGFVKGIDPLGSAYKFTEYFTAFGMEWMNFSSLFFSILLSLLEFTIGAALLFNITIRPASLGALVFMIFFTPLTLILAITDPISDCGCFGDAWVLDNWSTFAKNVILLLMATLVFLQRKQFHSPLGTLQQAILILLIGAGMFSLSLYCYRYLPILDFRPYATGTNIPEKMRVPAGEEPDLYEVTLTYKNLETGDIQAFSEKDYPWQDTIWEFVNSEEKLIKKGYVTEIHDLIIEHPEEGNITSAILEDSNYTLLAIARQVNEVSPDIQKQLNQLAEYARRQGYHFYGITSSPAGDIEKFSQRHRVPYEFCTLDDTQIKTMIRSNPGLMVLQSGNIIGKWAGRDLPDIEQLQGKDIGSYSILKLRKHQDRNLIYLLGISVFVLYILLYILSPKKRKHINKYY